MTDDSIYDPLVPPGSRGLGDTYTPDVYLEAKSEFATDCDTTLTAEFTPEKPRSRFGLQAAVVRLSKRLEELAEAYFDKFFVLADDQRDRAIEGGYDRAKIEQWEWAVRCAYPKRIWRDVQIVWANWLRHIEKMTENVAYGEALDAIDNQEYTTQIRHGRRMRTMLRRVALRHSIPEGLVKELLQQTSILDGSPRQST